ncbi:succinate--CoA ligase subunit beta [Candidatus Methylacidithermus pantelleriae]|uniref:Succinyl-CoA synthetase, beta subunit n=1 Tax=Candidatus Methylacidithermus pantelleriae TaxID=2744239 RepID=A0A8J2FTM7_9BACT|nr:ATP-grasp domain-containing protein [Candidatus Methylacidithermus pantelleriae]CAF0703611.1 Succinyl-CoA synthetase, beta subunit [Candidatus Methylacidithermus pantelleriae]
MVKGKKRGFGGSPVRALLKKGDSWATLFRLSVIEEGLVTVLLNEWEGRRLLEAAGISLPRAAIATSAEEAEEIALRLGIDRLVIKPVIRAGGRGVGRWIGQEEERGGIAFAHNPREVRSVAEKMLGRRLATPQTPPEGELVRQVLLVEKLDLQREVYFAVLVDGRKGAPLIVASPQGGSYVEEQKQKRWIEWVHPERGWKAFSARRVAKYLGWDGENLPVATEFLLRLYETFCRYDCLLLEMNPLGANAGKGEPVIVDCRLFIDDNAWEDHPELRRLAQEEEEVLGPWKCLELGLSYVRLGGNIGCLVNGAGLAMATIDLIQRWGGKPANFCDVGGGADLERVKTGLRLLSRQPEVSVILVNIFGGILHCDLLAQALVEVVEESPLTVPVIVRLEGTRAREAWEVLQKFSELFEVAGDFEQAVRKAVTRARR